MAKRDDHVKIDSKNKAVRLGAEARREKNRELREGFDVTVRNSELRIVKAVVQTDWPTEN